MTLKNIVAAMAAGIALASPLAAKAYEYNDGTYIWGFDTYVNDNNERVASLSEVRRVDEQKIEGAITFPATISLTVTNELGYSKWDGDWATGKYVWVSTRPQKVVTLTLPVESIDWWEASFKTGPVHVEVWGTWRDAQDDPLIESITIPEGVKYVYNLNDVCLTNVTAVSFPSTVEEIAYCFRFCDKLASVSVPEDAYIDEAFIGTPWARSMGDFFIWNGNLIRYQGTATEVVVPEGVETLGTEAFSPDWVGGFTEEQEEMFASATNITSVTLPSSLEVIGSYVFHGCEKLAAINIPNGVYDIGSAPFEYTAISSLVLPEGIQSFLRSTCASMTNLTSVTIPSCVKEMEGVFWECSKLTSVDIPDSVEIIHNDNFGACEALTNVTGCAGLKTVNPNAFGGRYYWDEEKGDWVTHVPYYDNAPYGIRALGPVAYGYNGSLPENLVIPGNIKYVMAGWTDYENNEENVKTLTLSDGVEALLPDMWGRVDGPFAEYPNLETVNLGNTVTNLSYAFYLDTKLATVTGGAALESGIDAFIGTKYQQDLADLAGNDEPFELIRLGKVVFGYKGKFAAGAFAIPDEVTEFDMLSGLWDESTANVTALTGGAALTKIDCCLVFEKLQRIELTGALKSFRCSNSEVTEINLPNAKLQWVAPDAFGVSSDLVNVTIGIDPDGLREAMIYGDERGISSMAFMQCDKLQSVNVICKGCKVAGFETWFETGKETFANELSTFKYGNERVDFSAPGELGLVNSEPFYLIPTLVKEGTVTVDDPDAVVDPDGDEVTVWLSGNKTSVVVAFDAKAINPTNVTVVLPAVVESVTLPEGTHVRVLGRGVDPKTGKPADVTSLLDIPAARNGVIDLTKATVKEEVVKEILEGDGAEVELNPEDPSIKTAKTKPGLLYTFREGMSLEGLGTKDPDETKVGDGEAWTPTISVKGGKSAFYMIGVEK